MVTIDLGSSAKFSIGDRVVLRNFSGNGPDAVFVLWRRTARTLGLVAPNSVRGRTARAWRWLSGAIATIVGSFRRPWREERD